MAEGRATMGEVSSSELTSPIDPRRKSVLGMVSPAPGEDPCAHPFSTKLSMTFFSPAFSKATVSLLPSTAVTAP
jgi:hypothetical protein